MKAGVKSGDILVSINGKKARILPGSSEPCVAVHIRSPPRAPRSFEECAFCRILLGPRLWTSTGGKIHSEGVFRPPTASQSLMPSDAYP